MKALKAFFKTMFLNFLIIAAVVMAAIYVLNFPLFVRIVGNTLEGAIAFGIIGCVIFVAIKKRLPFTKA